MIQNSSLFLVVNVIINCGAFQVFCQVHSAAWVLLVGGVGGSVGVMVALIDGCMVGFKKYYTESAHKIPSFMRDIHQVLS